MNKVLTASLLLAAATGCASFQDSDEDGLNNAEEAELGTDPELADTDGDGLSDLDERDGGTDPLAADTDGDGLSDGDEAALGSDPHVADTDGDGLTDGEEAEYGSDPTSEDGDGDGYLDAWEIAEGSDPSNAGSLIYQCGWTYNPDKDALNGPSRADADAPALGVKFPRVEVMDRCGDTFDIYDVSGQGVPVAIDISAIWCGPCNGIASWITGQGDSYGFGRSYPGVPEAIEEGRVIWVTILGENARGGPPSVEALENWYRQYPEEGSPLVADSAALDLADLLVQAWPSIYLLDEEMSYTFVPSDADYYGALREIGEL